MVGPISDKNAGSMSAVLGELLCGCFSGVLLIFLLVVQTAGFGKLPLVAAS